MALRVARGLLRLWAVLSALWIGGVAVAAWWKFPVNDWVYPDQNPPPGFIIDKPPFDPAKSYTVVKPSPGEFAYLKHPQVFPNG
jgi:hypothetical protein